MKSGFTRQIVALWNFPTARDRGHIERCVGNVEVMGKYGVGTLLSLYGNTTMMLVATAEPLCHSGDTTRKTPRESTAPRHLI